MSFIPGLELARKFYQEAIRLILQSDFSCVPYSAAPGRGTPIVSSQARHQLSIIQIATSKYKLASAQPKKAVFKRKMAFCNGQGHLRTGCDNLVTTIGGNRP
jgi:hypothetical protein